MTVLLWGAAGDPVIAAVGGACSTSGVQAVVVDADGLRVAGSALIGSGAEVPLADLSGVLVRPSAAASGGDALAALDLLDHWAEDLGLIVLNRPSAALSNRSRPYQLHRLSQLGWQVPDTLVTTDPDAASSFVATHGQVIHASLSGPPPRVSSVGHAGAPFADGPRWPTLVQERLVGSAHRVHVVDDRVFAARIEPPARGHRPGGQDGSEVEMAPVVLPEDVAERCVDTTASLGLRLAGLDLLRDRDGGWWCLEVSTAPGFSWFEDRTGHPVAAAVASALAGGF